MTKLKMVVLKAFETGGKVLEVANLFPQLLAIVVDKQLVQR